MDQKNTEEHNRFPVSPANAETRRFLFELRNINSGMRETDIVIIDTITSPTARNELWLNSILVIPTLVIRKIPLRHNCLINTSSPVNNFQRLINKYGMSF
tara:strand:+ start:920 stop:1219 length:300 start_codon:yes stop_codon:yes gene_type:complete